MTNDLVRMASWGLRLSGCGCDTVGLVDVRGTRDWERQDVLAEAVDEVSGLWVHLLIDEDTARPTVLEVYGSNGARFPALERLRLVHQDRQE